MKMDLSIYFSADFLMSFVTLANVLGAVGGLCTVASMSMKTVIPLRIAGIASAFFFLCSGIFARSFPSIFLYAMLLPLNSVRLYQMMDLIKKVRAAASSDLSMDWLQPFMTRRRYKKGEIIFRKGDIADQMFLAAKGKYLVSEINIELRPGHIFGEMGLLTSGSQRTASVECIESGQLLTISYDKVRELYFENPEFGFYFLRLVGERLLQNLKRAEDMLAAERQKHSVAAADPNPAVAHPNPALDAGRNERSHDGLLRQAYENLYLIARIRGRSRPIASIRAYWSARLRGRSRSIASIRAFWIDRLRRRMTTQHLRRRSR
jgi:CRP-like cAMP-binding protein